MTAAGTAAIVLVLAMLTSTAVAVSGPMDDLPVAVCRNATVSLDFFGDAVITPSLVDDGSHDAEGPVTLTVSPAAFTCADVGPNTVILEVADSAGQIDRCEAIVTVVDDTPPLGLYDTLFLSFGTTGTVSITPGQVVGGEFDACGIVDKSVSRTTFTCADLGERDSGTVDITVTLVDASGNVSVNPATIYVYFEPGSFTASPTVQSVEYGDLIHPVTVEINDPCEVVAVYLDAPPGSLDVAAAGPGTWIVSGQMLEPNGTQDFEARAVLFDLGWRTAIGVAVEPEAATLSFDPENPVSIPVSAPGGTSPPFSLSVEVFELESADGLAGAADRAGDISLADVSMSLVPVDAGPSRTGVCTALASVPGLPDPGSPFDYDRMTVVCTFDEVPVGAYRVEATVSGDYYQGAGEDVLTVFEPGHGDFAAGGGHFYWPGTAEDGYPGDRTTFAFHARRDTRRPNPGGAWGNLRVVRHLRNGGVLRLKSTTLDGLTLGSTADTGGSFAHAWLSGEAILLGAGRPEADGPHAFTVYVEDRGHPGAGEDRFWLTTGSAHLSMAGPGPANARTLSGGNILVPRARRNGDLPVSPFPSFPANGRGSALFQNAPNPFFGATRIAFQLAEDSHVRLSIFDGRGSEVARLMDRPLTAGPHEAVLDGAGLPAGVYFYRLQAGPFTETRRLMLLR